MPDTVRSRDELITLYADNTAGAISAQDGRDLIMSSVPVVLATDFEITADLPLWSTSPLAFVAAADSVYSVQLNLFVNHYNEPAHLNFQLGVPAGGLFQWANIPGTTAGFQAPQLEDQDFASGLTMSDMAVAQAQMFLATVTTDEAGTVALKAANNTTDGPSTVNGRIMAGSMMLAVKAG